jgi:hypothetical protein
LFCAWCVYRNFIWRHVNSNRRNFVFIYTYNVRYMGYPKRSGQWPVFWI